MLFQNDTGVVSFVAESKVFPTLSRILIKPCACQGKWTVVQTIRHPWKTAFGELTEAGGSDRIWVGERFREEGKHGGDNRILGHCAGGLADADFCGGA
jgi:hypothetical protein